MDYSTWIPQPRTTDKPPFSFPVPHAQVVEGETIPRRHPLALDGFLTVPEEGCNTLYDVLIRCGKKYGNERGFGTRKIVNKHIETKKIKKVVDGRDEYVSKDWTYFELSSYSYITYNEYVKLALELGSSFRKLGLGTGDKIHVYAATSMHWLAMAHGAASQSMPVVTAYDTLGEEGLTHSLKATKAKLMFLDSYLLKTLINPLKEASHLQVVVYDKEEDLSQKDLEALKKAHPHLKIMSFEDLRQLGEDYPAKAVPPTSEDICCVMYTSGSTGAPKGVTIKHRSIVGSIAGGGAIIHNMVTDKDVYLAYLPLAHIIEFILENCALFWGMTMGYGSPKTLTDASVRNCKGDLGELRPTILAGVPAVWENVRKGVTTKVNQSNAIVRNMFWAALHTKSFLLSKGLPGAGLIDRVIFSKVREATGGRLRLTLTGGGPIAKETHQFVSMVVCMLISGYGLTETTGMSALADPHQWTLKSIGTPPPTVEIKLVDFAEAGYHAKNNQGEVWVRGPAVSDEYYENPEENAKAFTSDGWFKTGDIGEWDDKGLLRIIDRTKNLVKTLNGEYIAIEKLESLYRTSGIVANICVYADANCIKPIAIIFPAEPALNALAKSNGIKEEGMALCHNKKIQELVLKELQAKGKAGGLAGMEIIDGVVLTEEEWTPQNNLVTPAQKLNRRNILKRYQNEVKVALKSN